ncbi:transcription factor grauzone-like [Sitodiplosis mosellana]|uniref:transcription factor grauzone-like n=1 Tax=Sitodiplosis mosellana TaxID=263140 RepID=UPI002443F745|nr:transcription factor grauzone-like [Sitodiplosis mosellana]
MKVKKEPDRCRLCYTQVVEYFDIFENSAQVPNIVDTLKQYFDDEVNDSDILPKVICIECWDKVEAFRKFSEVVIAFRAEYLRQHLNNAVKDENDAEYMIPNIEERIHREIVCVDPLRPIKVMMDEGDENMELEESKLHYGSGNEQGFSDVNEVYDELIDRNGLLESGEGIRLPRHISEVSPEQQQQIIDQYFDMNCDFCDVTFGKFEEAIQHYKVKHNNRPKGYVKCCSLKWSQNSHLNAHIVWHLNPELFKCQICGQVKKTYQSYQQHKLKHFNQFTCDICQKVFTVFSTLERHILEVHATKVEFPCDQCDQRFKTRKHLEIHLEVNHSKGLEDYIKEIKCMEFNNSDVHVMNIMEEYFDRKCDLCDTVLETFKFAKSHYSSEHNIHNPYMKCCGIKLHNNSQVLDHIQWHIDPNTFRCRVCKLKHKHRYTLIDHVKRHNALSAKQFACKICDRYYATNAQHRTHMELKHPGIQLSSSSVESNSKGDNNIEIPDYVDASCDMCPATTFITFKEMQSHYSETHKSVGSVSCCQKKYLQLSRFSDHIAWHTNPDTFKCDVCNKSLPNRYILKQHNDWHSNKYYCHTCQKSFPRRNLLRNHLEKHKNRNREKQRNFICDMCDKRFPSQNHLNIHRKRHDLRDDQICEFCAKKFKTKAELKLHQAKHLDVAPKTNPKFQCDICNGWYASKSVLKTHKMKHNPDPQKCNQCDKVCPNSAALDQHVRRNHSGTIFNCHLCEKSFKSQVTLKDHIATHTNKKSYKCTYCDETFIWRSNMYKHRKQQHEEEWLADKKKK